MDGRAISYGGSYEYRPGQRVQGSRELAGNSRALPGVRVRRAGGTEERWSAICSVGLSEFCSADWCEHPNHGEPSSLRPVGLREVVE